MYEHFISLVHSCVRGTDNIKHENEIDLFEEIDENVSPSKYTNHCFIQNLCKMCIYAFYHSRNPNTNAQIAQCCAIYEKPSQGRHGQG